AVSGRRRPCGSARCSARCAMRASRWMRPPSPGWPTRSCGRSSSRSRASGRRPRRASSSSRSTDRTSRLTRTCTGSLGGSGSSRPRVKRSRGPPPAARAQTGMRPGSPWREFGVLVGAGLVGVLLVLPYQLALLPAPPIPLPVLVLAAFVQSAILLAVATGLGLAAARRVGLGAPFVEASLYGGDSRAALRALQLPLPAPP